jgi:glutaminyl-peptide cyclotransferase
MFAAVDDVTGESANAERELAAEVQQSAEEDKEAAKDQEGAAEFAESLHRGIIGDEAPGRASTPVKRQAFRGKLRGREARNMNFKSCIFPRFANLAVMVLGFSLTVCVCAHLTGGTTRERAKTLQGTEHSIPVLTTEILRKYPHDPHAFTQGLEYFEGFLYESTGETGQSSVRKVELESGRVLQKTDLSSEYFGEGLTVFRGKIYQLTWLSKTGFVYDLRSLGKLREFHYDGEGWGLAHDASNLILSDGTNRLRYLDPESFKVVRTLEVYAGSEAVTNLNELEYIGNKIYANVWHSNRIARIDASSGHVLAWIDFSVNGIAYDPARHRLFVTGKDWAHLFEVRIQDITF